MIYVSKTSPWQAVGAKSHPVSRVKYASDVRKVCNNLKMRHTIRPRQMGYQDCQVVMDKSLFRLQANVIIQST